MAQHLPNGHNERHGRPLGRAVAVHADDLGAPREPRFAIAGERLVDAGPR
jgi:hypothetical protein